MLYKSSAQKNKQISTTLLLRTEVSIFKIKSFSLNKETVILKLISSLNNIKMDSGHFWLKARLHRRFFSQQLDAIFVALKVATSKSHV